MKKNSSISIEELKTNFSTWLGTKVTKLDNGTFLQVHPEYYVESKKICKHCLNIHKKGCCKDYNRLEVLKILFLIFLLFK